MTCHFLDRDPGVLGGRTLAFGPGSGPEKILNLTSDREQLPEVVTLSFDVAVKSRGVVAGGNQRLQAELQWGSFKGRGDALIDLRHGLRVSLECSTLVVSVFYAGTIGPSYDVYASVGRGSVGKFPPMTLTMTQIVMPAAAGASSGLLALPKYAHELRALSTRNPFGMPFADYLILFYTDALGPTLQFAVEGDEEPVLIPEGAEFVEFVNGRNGVAQNLTPVVGLTL